MCLQIFNTFSNINETNNKIQILIKDGTEFDIVIDLGCYELEDIKNKWNETINKYNNEAYHTNKIHFDLDVWVQIQILDAT